MMSDDLHLAVLINECFMGIYILAKNVDDYKLSIVTYDYLSISVYLSLFIYLYIYLE